MDLWNEIFSRTQGSNERVIIYISIMESLFNRLSLPPSEHFMLQLILRNLQPYFQLQLSLQPPMSYMELKYFCRNLEDTKYRTERFKEPPQCTSSTLEPELAYRKVQPNRNKYFVNEISSDSVNPSDLLTCNNLNVQPNQVNSIRTLKCWNCNAPGYAYNKCNQPRTIFCYGCGEKGVIKRKCLKCKPKNEVTTASPSADTVKIEEISPN